MSVDTDAAAGWTREEIIYDLIIPISQLSNSQRPELPSCHRELR